MAGRLGQVSADVVAILGGTAEAADVAVYIDEDAFVPTPLRVLREIDTGRTPEAAISVVHEHIDAQLEQVAARTGARSLDINVKCM